MSFVRVLLPNGHEASLSADYVAGIEGVVVLDEPATDLRGKPLPATRRNGRRIKPRTPVKKAAAKKAAAASKNPATGGDAEGGTTA